MKTSRDISLGTDGLEAEEHRRAEEYPSDPAMGIINGVILGAALWLVLAAVAWLLLG